MLKDEIIMVLWCRCHLPLLYVGLEYGLTNNSKLAERFFNQALTIAADDPYVLHEIGVIAFQSLESVNTSLCIVYCQLLSFTSPGYLLNLCHKCLIATFTLPVFQCNDCLVLTWKYCLQIVLEHYQVITVIIFQSIIQTVCRPILSSKLCSPSILLKTCCLNSVCQIVL